VQADARLVETGTVAKLLKVELTLPGIGSTLTMTEEAGTEEAEETGAVLEAVALLLDGAAEQERSKRGCPKRSAGLTREKETSSEVAWSSSKVNHQRLVSELKSGHATSSQ
jgi:hypothetical protein